MEHTPGFLKIVNEAKTRIRETDIAGYEQMLKGETKPLLVDVREDREYDASHAQGAVHISKGVIERDIETKVPDKNAALVLYCGGGFRSALAADALQQMGYTDVTSLAGGWRAWQEAGLPTSGN